MIRQAIADWRAGRAARLAADDPAIEKQGDKWIVNWGPSTDQLFPPPPKGITAGDTIEVFVNPDGSGPVRPVGDDPNASIVYGEPDCGCGLGDNCPVRGFEPYEGDDNANAH